MLDQSFSANNFKTILDLENRKGVFLEGAFFPDVKEATDKLKDCNQEIRIKRKQKNVTKDDLRDLYNKRRDLKGDKNAQLNSELIKVSKKVQATDFKIELTQIPMGANKPLYTVKDTPECYFTMKQIQRNVSRLFGVKQSNRFEIVSQVTTLLNDSFPKYVLRTDIDDFYESIPHNRLLDKIHGNNLLSPFSRKILRQILYQYKGLANSDRGIPRGIGVSAYLAELYMRDIDKRIMAMADVLYYARYVDDIIIIFTPTTTNHQLDYLNKIKNIIENDFDLRLNDSPPDSKTLTFDLTALHQASELEYLGYRIIFGDGDIRTRLTDKKITKYRKRIDLAFNNYSHLSKVDSKEARKLLIKRLRFLTGNTRLKNNKNNVLVGIYYSNPHLTEVTDLISLDDYLRTKINTLTQNRLQNRLRKFSFVEGFRNRRFSPFKTHDLKIIMKIWQ